MIKDSLRRFDPGHVSITEDRKSIGLEFEHILDRLSHGGGDLFRQTINQIEIDILNARMAQRRDGLAVEHHLLHPMDRFLHLGIGVLDPERRTIDSHLGQHIDVLRSDASRIDFDTQFGIRREREFRVKALT